MTTAEAGTVIVEPTRKRIRVLLGGELVADTTAALLVWENPYYPAYYIPAADVRAELIPAGTDSAPNLGDAEVLTVKVATATAEGAARRYPAAPDARLRDCVRFDWKAMTSGWRRMSRYTCTRAARTPGSTSWQARGTSGSRSTA